MSSAIDCNAPRPKSHVWGWDKVFMREAHMLKRRSKDPCTQVGAVIVDVENLAVSNGYNGMPCGDDTFPWSKDPKLPEEDRKYLYVVHAELNAILNGDRRAMKGATMYTTLYPCNECAKAIAQVGIKKVVYDQPAKHAGCASDTAAKRIFTRRGVEVSEYVEEEEDC